MAENSKIEWTNHTWNPWRGCTKVSAGCANCYAETMSGRNPGTLGVWGPNGTRVVASEAMWKQPLKWNKQAEDDAAWHSAHRSFDPERPRVFCASLADVFEDWQGPMLDSKGQELAVHRGCGNVAPWDCEWVQGSGNDFRSLTMQDVRTRLFRLIDDTPNLDWLLLTKRPENIAKMMPAYFPGGYIAEAGTMNQEGERPNVWLGTSVENQQAADERIPHLLSVPAKVRFLSIEPLLGPIDLSGHMNSKRGYFSGVDSLECCGETYEKRADIDWVIVGGESGHGARPCRVEWIRDIVRQCKAAGVPVFVKQMGGNVITRNDMIEDAFNNGESGWPDPDVQHNINGFREEYQGADCRIKLADKKGGDWSEWPEDLRVRQFPNVH